MKNILPYSFICRYCAERKGAKPITGHICTMHQDVCKYCGKEKELSGINDFIWPDRKQKHAWD